MVSIEKPFPRGGGSISSHIEEESSSSINFGAIQKKPKKLIKKSANIPAATENEDSEQLQAFSAETLTLDTLQEHMLVMGVVKEVDPTWLKIALPGRLTARATVGDISDAYFEVAKSATTGASSEYHDLTELFTPGRIVYGRASNVEDKENNRHSLQINLRPSFVNNRLEHADIKKGFIFSGAISEIQDHGLVIETGIDGLHAFVPHEEGSGKNHFLGDLLFLKVKDIQHTEQQLSICKCEQVDQDKLKIKSQNESNLDYILPGSIVKFKVTKHLKNGLEGNMLNESFRGYVNEHHLAEALHTPRDYELNEEYQARVLYVMPLTKLVYLTFNLDLTVPDDADEDDGSEEKPLKKGSIVQKARVLRQGTGGIILLLNQKHKGLISYASIKSNFKGNYDQDVVLSKYSSKSKHSVRVLGYDVVEALYYCTDDPNVLKEKQYILEDIHAGDIVEATIVREQLKIGGYTVKVGHVNGIIERLQLAPNVLYEVGQRLLRCRVLDVSLDRKTCYLSNRSEYLNKEVKLLCSLQAAHVGSVFTGTVVKCEPNYVLVKFCNGIKGVLHKQRVSVFMENSFSEGVTTKFRIAGRSNEQLLLTLPEDKFQMGEICPIEVTSCLDSGLEIKITCVSEDNINIYDGNNTKEEQETEEFSGLVPIQFLSDYVDLQGAQCRVHSVNSHLKAASIVNNVFSVRDVPYFSESVTKNWQTVQVGDILRAHVKNVTGEVVELLLPVRNYDKLVKVHTKMLCMNSGFTNKVTLERDQLLYAKVLSKEVETKTLTVSAKLTDVWSGQLSDTAKLMESYLDEIEQIKRGLANMGLSIAKFTVGEKVEVVFQGITPDNNNWVYGIEGDEQITCLMVSSLVGPGTILPEMGTKHSAVILWIDYANDILMISNKTQDIQHINSSSELPTNLIAKAGMKAKVLLKLNTVAVCSLKKGDTNPLVICPIRLHPNDLENSASNCLREGDFCNLAFIHAKLPIAVPETVWKLWKGVKRSGCVQTTVEPEKKKAKREVSKSQSPANKESGKKKMDQFIFEDKKPSTPTVADVVDDANAKARLPGVSSFWEDTQPAEHVSSDEDEENLADDGSANKKKRLSSKEKAKAEVKEEQRIREFENQMADVNHEPETIEQFERLVMAQPNSSEAWIKYMSFLTDDTQIDRARQVADRAIRTISFRETVEILNVWTALLNLDLNHNISLFEDTLQLALKQNEPLMVYMNLIQIYKSAGQAERLINNLNILLRKFRTEPIVWRAAAEAYFWLGMADQVQPALQRALKMLPNNEHINCIVAFAKLYAKNDDHAMAQTLLDDIVTSYPKRTDIWVLYVDMLIKSGLIDSARNVLERAVTQKIKQTKLHALFKKYLEFETKHGTETTIARVKQLAEQYVENQNKNQHT